MYTSKQTYELISKTTNNPILEWRVCRLSGEEFPIFQSEKVLLEKMSPTVWWQTIHLPLPTICREERQKRRLSHKNERRLYKRYVSQYDQTLLSMYDPQNPQPVMKIKDYFSDSRDAQSYGKLRNKVDDPCALFHMMESETPKRILMQWSSVENSDYTNSIGSSKNCYRLFNADGATDCLYGRQIKFSDRCMDSFFLSWCSQCYECINCSDCGQLWYSELCKNSHDSLFLYNCNGCDHCLFCSNLNNQSYYIRNKSVSKEEYLAEKSKIDIWSSMNVRKYVSDFSDFINKEFHSATVVKNCDNCSGHNITDWVDSLFCFDCNTIENCHYSTNLVSSSTDCLDVDGVGFTIQMVYNSNTVLKNSSHVYCCQSCWTECYNLFYSSDCKACKNCLFCNGLVNKEYCIFNTQYTKDEYESLFLEIAWYMQKQWTRWEFPAPQNSSFGYNETVSNDLYPLTREQALSQWFKRQDNVYDVAIPLWSDCLSANDLSDHIQEVDDSILSKVILCSQSKRPFRLQKVELDFYRTHSIPIPRFHPDVRYQKRLEVWLHRKLFTRNCSQTSDPIVSIYDKDVLFPVLKNDIFDKLVYS